MRVVMVGVITLPLSNEAEEGLVEIRRLLHADEAKDHVSIFIFPLNSTLFVISI